MDPEEIGVGQRLMIPPGQGKGGEKNGAREISQ